MSIVNLSKSIQQFIVEIEIAERLAGIVADDKARVVVLFNRPRRREAVHGSDDSAISALRRKRRSAILMRRVAKGQTTHTCGYSLRPRDDEILHTRYAKGRLLFTLGEIFDFIRHESEQGPDTNDAFVPGIRLAV